MQVEASEFGVLLHEKLHTFGATLRDRDLEIFRARLVNDEPATVESAIPTGSTQRTPTRFTSACATPEKMMIVRVRLM